MASQWEMEGNVVFCGMKVDAVMVVIKALWLKTMTLLASTS
jgi:hypothetical protein